MQQIAVNETEPHGVLFVMRPPNLSVEPQREDHDQSSDDAKMETICERIRRVRKDDLSDKSHAFWEAMEELHHKGRYAASVPSLPHTIKVGDEHSFTFEGCPQDLRPLLHELIRFERPLITWDLFNEAPPAEFRAPAALQLTGPGDGVDAVPDPTIATHLTITQCEPCEPSTDQSSGMADAVPSFAAPGAGGVRLPVARLPPPKSRSSATAGAPAEADATLSAIAQPPAPVSATQSTSTQPVAASSEDKLRDPRSANVVSHAGYSKAQQAQHRTQLSFEDWKLDFPGRVEAVKADRLYVVKLAEADGEMRLGLIQTTGKPFVEHDDEIGEQVSYVKSSWFKRCSDEKRAWGANPEFEHYMDGDERVVDTLPTESCLLEVEDCDLTDGSVEQKWSKPKLKQCFMAKVRWIAETYGLQAAAPSGGTNKGAKRQKR